MADCNDIDKKFTQILTKLDSGSKADQSLANEIDRLKGEIVRLNQLVKTADDKGSSALSAINPLETKAAQAL